MISFRFFRNYKHNRLESKGVVSASEHWEAYTGDWVSSNEAGIRMDIDAAIEAIPNSRDREIAKMVSHLQHVCCICARQSLR